MANTQGRSLTKGAFGVKVARSFGRPARDLVLSTRHRCEGKRHERFPPCIAADPEECGPRSVPLRGPVAGAILVLFRCGNGLFMTMPAQSRFCTVEEAVEEIRNGRMVVLVDDEDRENEGDLAMAAEKITPEAINFMAKYGRGLICMPLTEERCDELHLPLMSPINTSVHQTAFTEAIDARVGVTTGISASDRAITILTAVDPKTKPQDLARPGHI